MKNKYSAHQILINVSGVVTKDTLLGCAIIGAINSNAPAEEIILWLSSQAQDDPEVMGRVLGEELTNILIIYKHKK